MPSRLKSAILCLAHLFMLVVWFLLLTAPHPPGTGWARVVEVTFLLFFLSGYLVSGGALLRRQAPVTLIRRHD